MRSLHTPLALTLVAVVALPVLGCERLQARIEFKHANSFYKEENYKAALNSFQHGLQKDPTAYPVWRSVGLSAMALYRVGDDSPENLAYATTAVDAFRKYSEHFPEDTKAKEYILSILMNAKRFDDVLATLREESRQHPENKELKRKIIDVMVRQGKWEEAFNLVNSARPQYGWEPFYLISVYCWDKSYRDPTIDLAARTKFVDLGMKSVAIAIEMNPQSFESMAYYNLLYREKAKLEPDEEKQRALIDEAEKWREKAKVLIEEKRKREQEQTAKAASS